MAETYSHAILAGGGELPRAVVQHVLQTGEGVLVLSFTGQPQPQLDNLEGPLLHITHPLGAAGRTIKLLKQYGVKTVIMAGYLNKPNVFDLKPDATGLGLLAKLSRKHDNDYLTLVEGVLGKEGFVVKGAHEVCGTLCPNEKEIQALSPYKPSKAEEADIAHGAHVLRHMAALDIGQAVVVKNGVVLGVEAVEGTDALLKRCAALRGGEGKGGVMVKLPKQGQTLKADLPTIGPETLDVLAAFNYAGVAVLPEQTIILSPDVLKEKAKQANVFIAAVKPQKA